MIRKVMAGEELLRAAALSPRSSPSGSASGPTSTHTASTSQSTGDQQRFGLPRAEKLSRLLHEQACRTSINVHELSDDDYIETTS